MAAITAGSSLVVSFGADRFAFDVVHAGLDVPDGFPVPAPANSLAKICWPGIADSSHGGDQRG
jgi:hypothetical protein